MHIVHFFLPQKKDLQSFIFSPILIFKELFVNL